MSVQMDNQDSLDQNQHQPFLKKVHVVERCQNPKTKKRSRMNRTILFSLATWNLNFILRCETRGILRSGYKRYKKDYVSIKRINGFYLRGVQILMSMCAEKIKIYVGHQPCNLDKTCQVLRFCERFLCRKYHYICVLCVVLRYRVFSPKSC